MIVQKEPETTNSLSAEAIAETMGIAGPLQLVASLPGISSGQSDPYAMTIRAHVFVRGLPSSELGYLVGGVPAIDQAYFLPYSETWLDNENIAGVTILPGSSRITDAVQTAVAGEMIETPRNPSNEFGSRFSYSYGSYDAQRVFAGVDTGLIGDTGIKAYATYSHTQAGTFNIADAVGTRTHSDFKIEKDWDGAKSSLLVTYNDWDAERSNLYSLSGFQGDQRSGNYAVGNYSPTYIPGVTTNYWKNNIYFRKNILVGWNNEVSLNDRLTVTVTPYYHWTLSNSAGGSSLSTSSLYSGNVPVQINTSGLALYSGKLPVQTNGIQNENDAGVNAYAQYDVTEHNQLLVGWWHDHWNMTNVNDFTPLDQNGNVPNNWGQYVLYATNGQLVTGASYLMNANIDVASVQDTQLFFDDKLRIDVGAKYYMESLAGNNKTPGPQSYFSSSYARFLPRVTLSYDIDHDMQVYANAITSSRPAVPINTFVNTYSNTNGAISQLANPAAKPEYAIGEELGYRYHEDSGLTADIALFNKVVNNRQIVSVAFLNGAGVTSAISAGTETMQGVTAELALPSFLGFSPYVNGQYLRARTESNLTVGSDFLPVKGKVAPVSPEFTGSLGVSYKNGPFFANVSFKYTDSQYATFTNDESMPANHTTDLGIGYYLPEGYLGKSPAIRLNFTNLENRPYLSGISTIQPTAVTTKGIYGTKIAGAAPLYFVGSPLSVMATFSTEF